MTAGRVVDARAPIGWRLAGRVVGAMPRAWLSPLGALVGALAFDVLRIRRAHVLGAMARAGIGGASGASTTSIARASYVSLGVGALELLWLAGRPRASLEFVRVEGWERFLAAQAEGRGVVVVTAHTGNWDLAACACAARTPLSVVTKRLRARGLDAFWQSTRAARGLGLVPADARVLSTIGEQLRRGAAMALLIDQDPERRTSVVDADFLGAPALHDTLAATVAARAGAPIVVAFARRLPAGGHVVEIVDVLRPPPRAGSRWAHQATRRIAADLDAFVRRDPPQWLWLHRRWKTQPRRDQGLSDAAQREPHHPVVLESQGHRPRA